MRGEGNNIGREQVSEEATKAMLPAQGKQSGHVYHRNALYR